VTVGYFAPLPPLRTGVADYAEALLKALRRHGEVRTGEAGDIALYQIGNNQLHREIYERAIQRPGVVVLHDAVLQHFFLGSLGESAYIDEFTYNYGGWSEDFARSLWRGRARSSVEGAYFAWPMLRRIAQTAKAVIVHNPAAAAMVRSHAAEAEIVEIPHLFVPPALPPGYAVERLRGSWDAGGSTCVFGIFGHLRESKRVTAVLRAFARLRESVDARLLIAGGFVSRDLERAASPLLRAPGVLHGGYVPEDEFWLRAAAVDGCVNLRYPAAGETSGIAIRLMGIGKPVLMSAGEENARFPEAACIRVDTGAGEEDMLVETMAWLARNPTDARAIGGLAADHIAREHAPDRVAQLFWDVLRRHS
jgi:glycosyltransferase involved in cell wall biosynthesis